MFWQTKDQNNYQDAEKAIDTIVLPLFQEYGATLVPQQFFVVKLDTGPRGYDVVEGPGYDLLDRQDLETFGRKSMSSVISWVRRRGRPDNIPGIQDLTYLRQWLNLERETGSNSTIATYCCTEDDFT